MMGGSMTQEEILAEGRAIAARLEDPLAYDFEEINEATLVFLWINGDPGLMAWGDLLNQEKPSDREELLALWQWFRDPPEEIPASATANLWSYSSTPESEEHLP
jgi:hypothetical protein